MAQYRISYNYCGICGHQPATQRDEPNRAPVRWWDPDDGYKIGTLCRWCHEETINDKPKPGDYAYDTRDGQDLDNINTDEDPMLAF